MYRVVLIIRVLLRIVRGLGIFDSISVVSKVV